MKPSRRQNKVVSVLRLHYATMIPKLLETNITPLRYIHWLFCSASPETRVNLNFLQDILAKPNVQIVTNPPIQLAKYLHPLIPKTFLWVFTCCSGISCVYWIYKKRTNI
jgi:hypothetical protein